MWEFLGDSLASPFLVFAHLHAEGDERASPVTRAGLKSLPRERLIIHGDLSTPDKGASAGVVLAVQAPMSELVDGLLRDGPVSLDERVDVEIHDREFGGRR